MRTPRLMCLASIAAVTLTAGCARTDVGITTKIKAKLSMDEVVRTSEIDVKTRNGVVTLEGNIDSPEAKEIALTLAKETKGVVEVKDLISVKRGTDGGEAPDPGL